MMGWNRRKNMMFLTELLAEETKYFFEVDIIEQILRVLAAMLVGSIFGFEREMKGKPAGFITFMIVSMGACIIALLQINTISMIYNAMNSSNDPLLSETHLTQKSSLLPVLSYLFRLHKAGGGKVRRFKRMLAGNDPDTPVQSSFSGRRGE